MIQSSLTTKDPPDTKTTLFQGATGVCSGYISVYRSGRTTHRPDEHKIKRRRRLSDTEPLTLSNSLFHSYEDSFFQGDRKNLKPTKMGAIHLRVVLALLLVAVLGQARSFPGRALARQERAVPVRVPAIDAIDGDYDYEKSYRDDPNYYPDDDDDEYDDYLEYYDSAEDETHESAENDKDDDEEEEDDASSKEKRQYKGGAIQQNGHVKYDVDGAGSDQWIPVINELDDEISSGVEPLPPIQAPDVSKGVEAVDHEDDDHSLSNWVGGRWGDFVNAVGTVGDHVEDTFEAIGHRIHGAAHSAGSSIVDAYNSLKNRFSELREKIHQLFSGFGLMVQRGADYCIQHLQHTANQVREAQLLDKLQEKLKEGNEQVTAFFTILGEKVTSWAQSQGHQDVDEGLILVDSHLGQGGSTHGDHTEDEDGNREQMFPNLYRDQEVLEQMNKMVSQGVITQQELDLLYQTEQVVKPQQPNPDIRAESHTGRRNLRSRIVVL
ncbi:uncharacterized protein LOC135225892 [Macrobrachium nipponense]|uniref:uncharacterized protein LOC135225892 n=1 Tax=Macrobrachium nipponense TaxID=159736 RepID=UPI0030C7A1E5